MKYLARIKTNLYRNLALRLSASGIALLVLATSVAGCQQRTASQLLGRWVGRPDSELARAEREELKYGKGSDEKSSPAQTISSGSIVSGKSSGEKSDWERYDVTVSLNFISHSRLEMSLAGGAEPVSGSWQIVASNSAGCTIEIVTNDSPDTDESLAQTEMRRRFQLLLDNRDGQCLGFSLAEVGADRQLGTLYFHREESSLRNPSKNVTQ